MHTEDFALERKLEYYKTLGQSEVKVGLPLTLEKKNRLTR